MWKPASVAASFDSIFIFFLIRNLFYYDKGRGLAVIVPIPSRSAMNLALDSMKTLVLSVIIPSIAMMNRLFPLTIVAVVLASSTVLTSLPAYAEQPAEAVAEDTTPKIEVEAQYFIIGDSHLQSLGIIPSAQPNDSGPFTRGALPAGGFAQIMKMQQEKKAGLRLVTAPRVTVQNGVQSELRSYTTRPAIMDTVTAADGETLNLPNAETLGVNLSPILKQQTVLYTIVGIGITATANIAAPDALKLDVALGRRLKIVQAAERRAGEETRVVEKTFIDRDLDGIQILNNVKNGETVALVSDSTDFVRTSGALKPQPADSKMLVLLTARIVGVKR
jgi:hypothetical protein